MSNEQLVLHTLLLFILYLKINCHCRDCKIVPVKICNISAESTSSRLIDTGGGFLIEEPVPGKQSSLTTTVVYDPGSSFVCLNTLCLNTTERFLEYIIYCVFQLSLLVIFSIQFYQAVRIRQCTVDTALFTGFHCH